MSIYKLVVFDWDGTLMDSLSRIACCMQAAARDVGVEPASTEQVKAIVGLALDIAITRLHPQLSPHQLLLMRERYSFHYVQAETTPSAFFEGVTGLLTGLRERGSMLSVATGKSRKGLTRVLKAHDVGGWFDSSRCADETRSKPEPHMLLEIMAYHDLGPEELVMVGDTVYDLEMAQRAGVHGVGVTWGAHPVSQLQMHNPVLCADTVMDLQHWLYDNIAH